MKSNYYETITYFFLLVCTLPMGLENPLIVSDKQLSSSSSKDMFTGAERGRLYAGQDGSFSGGWVPR